MQIAGSGIVSSQQVASSQLAVKAAKKQKKGTDTKTLSGE